MRDMFGKRYMSVDDMRSYVTELSIASSKPSSDFFEFLEREKLLSPVCRVQYPPPILRRLEQEERPGEKIYRPIEPDGAALDAAVGLLQQLHDNKWSRPDIYGEHPHPLDDVEEAHKPFVQKSPQDGKFTSWDKQTTPIFMRKRYVIRSRKQFSPFFYHYWQVFWFATIYRSGVKVHYPLDDQRVEEAVRTGELPTKRSYISINLEAKHHLDELRQHADLFEAVGRYAAYRQHILQSFSRARDPKSGRLSLAASRSFRLRKRELAAQTFEDYGLSKGGMVGFIEKQTDWWSLTQRNGPERVADEYRKNISSSIELLRDARRLSGPQIVDFVGYRGGYRQPILKEIFPDWTEKQRELSIRSLMNWLKLYNTKTPLLSKLTEIDLEEFCDWIEGAGLQQYYWHFRRLADGNLRDGPVERASIAAEIVGFANLCEMIINEILKHRGEKVRGRNLSDKLKIVFGPQGALDLSAELHQYRGLVKTNSQSLAQRLAQINRISTGAKDADLLRTLLSLWAIRNEGSHHGLLKYDRLRLFSMLEALAIASLAAWLCR